MINSDGESDRDDFNAAVSNETLNDSDVDTTSGVFSTIINRSSTNLQLNKPGPLSKRKIKQVGKPLPNIPSKDDIRRGKKRSLASANLESDEDESDESDHGNLKNPNFIPKPIFNNKTVSIKG